ncbi:MAG: ribose-phosphate diphosphokinase [Candidatus Woesearchaeota archaeon]|nr:ribose-phosphate diphosphokinase [Candidatus Woesearchaeota archaeon]
MPKKERVIVGFSGSDDLALASAISKKAGGILAIIEVNHFPDKETNLRFKTDLKGKNVFIVRSLDDPDRKIVEVLLAAQAAKELGAKNVVLVAPYLCYMRQDKRFKPGQAISSRTIAKLVNLFFDGMITVDPHLHRYKSLDEIFKKSPKRLTAINQIAEFIKKEIRNPFIFGPDFESYQWARAAAKIIKCDVDVLKKHRYSSDIVRIKVKEKLDLSNKSAVIIDDVISTGHTVIEVVKDLKALGAKRIYCICTHGIFAEDSLKKIEQFGAKVFSTNTIKNRVSRIDVSGIIAEEILKST